MAKDNIITKTFSTQYLKDTLNLPWSAIEDDITDTSRWSVFHEIVFADKDGKTYSCSYSIGATECQDERPWQDENEVECIEVEKREVVVEKWMPIER